MHANEPTSTPTPATTDDTQSSTDATDRRAFLKGAAIVAGVAATGVLAAAPEANAAVRPKARAHIRVSFTRRQLASADASTLLHKALDEMLDQAGCPTCGLGGFDIHLEELAIQLKTEVAFEAVLEDGTLVL
jgi:hypothetical protein